MRSAEPSRPASAARETLAVALGVAVLLALLFAPAVFTGRLIAPGDGYDFYLPIHLSAPTLWEPDLFAGFPAFADPQEMEWYPPSRLTRGTPATWNLFLLSSLWLLGVGGFLAARALTGDPAAARFTALALPLAGYFTSHLRHATLLHTAAWLPLALYAQQRRRPVLLAVCVASSLVAGHPPTFAFSFIVLVGFALVWELDPASGEGRLARVLGGSLAPMAVGVGLGAVLWWPLLELVPHTVRAAGVEESGRYALPVRDLVQFVLPWAPGDPQTRFAYAERQGYLGVLPLLFAYAALRLARSRIAVYFGVVAGTGVLLSLGTATPLAGLVHSLPGLDRFRVPARHLLEVTMAVAFLAALGVAGLRRAEEARRRRVVREITGGFVGLFALSLVVAAAFPSETSPLADGVSAGELARPFLLLPLVMVSLSLLALRSWSAAAGPGPLLLVVLLLDLGSVAVLGEWRDGLRRPEELEPPEAVARWSARLAEEGGRFTPLLGTRQALEGAPPNLSRNWGVSSTSGFNPLLPWRIRDLLGMELWGPAEPAVLFSGHRGLDLLASRFVAVPRSLGAQLVGDPRWERVEDLVETTILRNRRALPEAWRVPAALRAEFPVIAAAVRTSRLPGGRAFDPTRVALVEDEVSLPGRSEPDPAVAVSWVEGSPNRRVLRTRGERPGLLVLSETFHPGWRAWVAGERRPVVRCNGALMGVEVPAEPSEVRLEFRPASRRAGALVSLASAGALLVGGLVRRRRRIEAPSALGDSGL